MKAKEEAQKIINQAKTEIENEKKAAIIEIKTNLERLPAFLAALDQVRRRHAARTDGRPALRRTGSMVGHRRAQTGVDNDSGFRQW